MWFDVFVVLYCVDVLCSVGLGGWWVWFLFLVSMYVLCVLFDMFVVLLCVVLCMYGV